MALTFLCEKVNFPVERVAQNVRHFIDVVKKGIKRGEQAEKGGQQRERDLNLWPCCFISDLLLILATTIDRVVLSSQQGPGITLSDVA